MDRKLLVRMVRICEHALEAYGELAQEDVAIEEMAELIHALKHLRRGKTNHEKVAHEVMGVLLMTVQLIVNLEQHGVAAEDILREKIDSLEQRIQ